MRIDCRSGLEKWTNMWGRAARQPNMFETIDEDCFKIMKLEMPHWGARRGPCHESPALPHKMPPEQWNRRVSAAKSTPAFIEASAVDGRESECERVRERERDVYVSVPSITHPQKHRFRFLSQARRKYVSFECYARRRLFRGLQCRVLLRLMKSFWTCACSKRPWAAKTETALVFKNRPQRRSVFFGISDGAARLVLLILGRSDSRRTARRRSIARLRFVNGSFRFMSYGETAFYRLFLAKLKTTRRRPVFVVVVVGETQTEEQSHEASSCR
jgi:hypothetical protein